MPFISRDGGCFDSLLVKTIWVDFCSFGFILHCLSQSSIALLAACSLQVDESWTFSIASLAVSSKYAVPFFGISLVYNKDLVHYLGALRGEE